MTLSTPWAVLFCKFKDDLRDFVTINLNDKMAMFTGLDAESIPSFWQNVTYSALDLSGSQAFGWLKLDKNQTDYVGSGANSDGRIELVTWARKAAEDQKIDLSPFYGTVVFMSTATDLWGSSKMVVCDAKSPMSAILQEYGHGYGLKHSRAVSSPTADYTNPVCVMSGMIFGGRNPTFAGRFGVSGPLLCSPYVDVGGWLSRDRVETISTAGAKPKITTMFLSSLGNQKAPNRQVARLHFSAPYDATYYIEFRAGGWDKGITPAEIAVHQLRPDGYSYYAGGIVDTTVSSGRSWVDPEFDLSVRIERIVDSGDTAEITIGPRAAALALSVRAIAAAKLNLAGPLGVRGQILRPGDSSLKSSLLTLVNQ
jgi:hypothetical protein